MSLEIELVTPNVLRLLKIAQWWAELKVDLARDENYITEKSVFIDGIAASMVARYDTLTKLMRKYFGDNKMEQPIDGARRNAKDISGTIWYSGDYVEIEATCQGRDEYEVVMSDPEILLMAKLKVPNQTFVTELAPSGNDWFF